MEFYQQGQYYKLYGIEGSTLKRDELQLMTKVQKAHTNTKHPKQSKCVPKSSQSFRLNNQVKQLQGMIHILQRSLANTQMKEKIELPKPSKDKYVDAMGACSARENPIYHALRTKYSLRAWQCNNYK